MAKRYCEMCDEWMSPRECRKCGAQTVRALPRSNPAVVAPDGTATGLPRATLSDPAASQPSAKAIRLDAAMRALESIQAQGYFIHDADGRGVAGKAYVQIITTALDAAMVEVHPASQPEQEPEEPEQAHAYLSRLLMDFAPQCDPLPSLLGLCSQIDNLLTGMKRNG